MLPESKICRFCCHGHRVRQADKRGSLRLKEWCELGIKKLSAQRRVDFRRCKGFEPNCEAIADREDTLRRVIRECEIELACLERLRVYAEHRRRRGAEYECVLRGGFEPLFPETGEGNISEGKTARACGFEEGETNESD